MTKNKVRDWFSENLAYKLVAFFVTLVLWLTIQGRKDTVATRDVRLEYMVPARLMLQDSPSRGVKVKVSGPRPALKKFMQAEEAITLELNNLSSGEHRIDVNEERLILPVGLRILSVTPKTVVVKLRTLAQEESVENGQQGKKQRSTR